MTFVNKKPPVTQSKYNYLEIETKQSKSVVRLLHDAGFFSNCTVLLFGILQSKFVSKLDSGNSFNLYQNRESDIFNEVFVQAENIDNRRNRISWRLLNYHSYYSDLPLRQLSFYIDHYFQTTPKVQNEIEKLLLKFQLNPDRCVGIYFRGTDKKTELDLPSIESIVSETLRLDPESYDTVILQTDDFTIQQRVKKLLGDKVILLENLDNKSEKIGQHFLPNNKDHIFHLIAGMKIIARCRYVYLNTSNVSLWIALFRGNSDGFIQFPKHGFIPRFKSKIRNRFSTQDIKRVIQTKT